MMPDAIVLQTPLSEQDVTALKIGDRVLLNGVLYTARDAAHKRLVELLEKGQPLPFDLSGQVIYYVGPSPAQPGRPVGAAGPTTSYRMDAYAPLLIRHGLRGMIGKGARSDAVKDAMRRHKAVYFAAIGGAGALMARSILSAEVIAYPELGPEAVRRLEVKDFPVIVANDVHGGDLYQEGVRRYARTA
ncbi:MAG: Fe-S-containing hydro-lyase [Desulfosoma sp.]